MTDQNWPAPGEPSEPPTSHEFDLPTAPNTYDPPAQQPPQYAPPPAQQPPQYAPPPAQQPPQYAPPSQPAPGYGAPPPGQPGFSQPPQYAPPGQMPQQPYGASAAGLSAEPEKKKRKIWPWLLGIFLFLVLGIGGCSYALFRAVSGPIDAANEFLAAATAGDYVAAADLVSSTDRCFGDTAESDLRNYFEGTALGEYNLNSSSVSSNNGTSTGVVSGTIDSLGPHNIEFSMVKEGGAWLVCGLNVD